jgi:hypothetical protein
MDKRPVSQSTARQTQEVVTSPFSLSRNYSLPVENCFPQSTGIFFLFPLA